jgi:predicted PurR-regulated permease PerM
MPPFRTPRVVSPIAWPTRLLVAGGVVTALYLGREVFAPLALALLLTVAALPLVGWLERRGLPRIAAVMLALLLLLALIGTLVWVVVGQALLLAGELPRYESVLREKLATISAGSGTIERLLEMGRRLSDTVAPHDAPTTATVVVAAASTSPLAGILALAAYVLAPVATLAITLLLMGFILVQREDVRDRALRLAGLHDLHRTTVAMTDAASRVGRFLLMQVAVNGIFGACMAGGLWLIGIPNAPLWGVLGFALRFVPYLGAPLAALFPLLLAFATAEGWTSALSVLGLFVVVDVVVSYMLEPWLYSASTGITPLALLLSSAFWVLLWGPLGLVVAPAFTACMAILGRHVPALAFLEVLLGDAPPLPAPARFYQRLLAGDSYAGARLLARESERSGVRGALEQLVLPAIAHISDGRADTGFGPALAVQAARTLLRVLETVSEPPEERAEVVVLPVGGALDRAAAATVAVALIDAGLPVSLTPRAGGHIVAVLVVADAAPAHRLSRALREAHQAADVVRVFAATEEATRALEAGAGSLPGTTALAALISDITILLETTAVPHE